MQLVGKEISHIKFGEGIVKESRDNYITITFSQGEKKFLYPKAFNKYLTLKDKKVQLQVNQALEVLQKEELMQQIYIGEQQRLHKLQMERFYPDSQAAFGFVQNNREEVFSTWSLYAGSYQSGSSKGKPKLPVRLRLNSACLLTECAKGVSEKKRRILGVFMPREEFEGAACKDGIINSHERYRIKLEDKETMFYWNYIPEAEQVLKWGNIEIRYISNLTMQKILMDMKLVISDLKRRQEMEDFYQYFCLVNKLEDIEH
ncbi:hypothetical protein acsn021_18060 [Anaerocolumna cellulosilytica]|uniref:Uncharacterized protein n=1 Tax=Anaerocolumna cellulosilytica TaxID=433286 RepID=A0A6S6R2C9_9FIRM|nr:hypothetical protein [Anaerocolumna cellulosilytica]MBB5194799.1 hypothetical protein [Anaerocolumna cellulosilytica]BCJ94237.1 hypothetical protein acsn021_18060 [Anaerocolumna cellulosilytica]